MLSQSTAMEVDSDSCELTIDDIVKFYEALVTLSNQKDFPLARIAEKIRENYLTYLSAVFGVAFAGNSFLDSKKRILLDYLNHWRTHKIFGELCSDELIENICTDIRTDSSRLISKVNPSFDVRDFINALVDATNASKKDLPHFSIVTNSFNPYPHYNHLVYIHTSSQASIYRLLEIANDLLDKRNWLDAIAFFENAKSVFEASNASDFDDSQSYANQIYGQLALSYYWYGRQLLDCKILECEHYFTLAVETSADLVAGDIDVWLEAQICLSEYAYSLAISIMPTDTQKAIRLLEDSMPILDAIITRYPERREKVINTFKSTLQLLLFYYIESFNLEHAPLELIDLSRKIIFLYEITPHPDNTQIPKVQIYINRQFISLNLLRAAFANPHQEPQKLFDLFFAACSENMDYELNHYDNVPDVTYQNKFATLLATVFDLIYKHYDLSNLLLLSEKMEMVVARLTHAVLDAEFNTFYNIVLRNVIAHINNQIEGPMSFAEAARLQGIVCKKYKKIDPAIQEPHEAQRLDQIYVLRCLMAINFSRAPRQKKNIEFAKQLIAKNLQAQFPAPDANYTFRKIQLMVAEQIFIYGLKFINGTHSYPVVLNYFEAALETLAVIPIADRTEEILGKFTFYNKFFDYLSIDILMSQKISTSNFSSTLQIYDDFYEGLLTNEGDGYDADLWYQTLIDIKIGKMYEFAGAKCDELIDSLRDKLLRKPYFFSLDKHRQQGNVRLRALYRNSIEPLRHNKDKEMLIEADQAIKEYLANTKDKHLSELKCIRKIIKKLLATDADYVHEAHPPRTRSYSI